MQTHVLSNAHLKSARHTPEKFQNFKSRELLTLSAHYKEIRGLVFTIGIVESTVHGLDGPPPSGRSLFTCRVAGDQIELNQ